MEEQILDNDLHQQYNENTGEWAGFWIRVGAACIDFLTYLPLLGFNMYNLYYLKNLPAQIIVTIILIIYKPLMEYKYGATLGKMAVKIKVVNLDLGQITISQAIIRNFPFWLGQFISLFTTVLLFTNSEFQSSTKMLEVATIQGELISPVINYLISAFTLISVVVVAFSEKKQGVHDMIAKTYCVYKK